MRYELGRTVRLIRQAKDMRLGTLAKKAEVSTPFLSLFEKGERQASLKVIRKIADALDVPSEVLVVLAFDERDRLHSTDTNSRELENSILMLAEAEDRLKRQLGTRKQ